MELTIIEVNKRKTRKAYSDKNGSIYLECGQCKEVKSVDDYYDHKYKGWYGKKSNCKKCFGLKDKQERQKCKDKLLNKVVIIDGIKLSVLDISKGKRKLYNDDNGVKYLDCTGCNKIKTVDKFSYQKKSWIGKASECKECMGVRHKDRYKRTQGKQSEERLSFLMNEKSTYNDNILIVIDVNQKRTRKAYKNDFGDIYLTCGKCKNIKPIDSFINSSKGFFKKEATCYECRRKQYYKYEVWLGDVVIVGNVKLTVVEVTERGRRKLTDDNDNVFLDCTACKVVKPAEEFRERDNFLFVRHSVCLVCDREKSKEWRNENYQRYTEIQRKWVNNNRERLRLLSKKHYYKNWEHIRNKQREYRKKDPERYREHGRKWARENSDYQVHLTRKRRARIRRLPYDLTTEQSEELLVGGCRLTGDKDNIHLDHIIPLNTGHGGTTYGNMMAIRGDLNNSKVDHNIFEWAKVKYKQFNFTMEWFNEIMTDVAKRNSMTLDEYRDYVYWCFDNPLEVKDEQLTHNELNKQDFYQRLEIAIDMYIKGETYKSIREETKIVSNTLLRYLREREIPTRRQKDRNK